ncbi:MAG: DUF3298 domain-containing protein [bacterium]|nr:DUF3298 domain-containing protein [bacterium]
MKTKFGFGNVLGVTGVAVLIAILVVVFRMNNTVNEIVSMTAVMKSPVISVSGPTETSLNIGEDATWGVSIVNYPMNSTANVSYYVQWGDEKTPLTQPRYVGPNTASGSDNSAKFSHAYGVAGRYFPQFTVVNQNNQSVTAYGDITVGDTPQPLILLSPKDRETLMQGIQVVHVKVWDPATSYIHMMIDVEYPQFGIPAADAFIKESMNADIARFKAIPPGPSDMATSRYDLRNVIESIYVGPDFISVKSTISEYTGGAHANGGFYGRNFDRTTGKQLFQDDAFRMIGLTLQEVSASATTQLKAKLGDNMFTEGANPNPENFRSFVISADKVTFIFTPYQVASYSQGNQEVSFPRKM